MIQVLPSNPNLVCVSMMQSKRRTKRFVRFAGRKRFSLSAGCCRAEFDKTYPIHLHGVISPMEFQASIERINRTLNSRLPMFLSIFFSLIFLLTGVILFIVGSATISERRTVGFPPLFGAALGILFFGVIMFPIICSLFQARRFTKLQKVILEESMKYSNRLDSPCSWRLNSIGFHRPFYYNQQVQLTQQVRRPFIPSEIVLTIKFFSIRR